MNGTPTIDRRVARTHKLLGEALIELAIEKGYDNVTIQDVTDRADIGYRTFFRHFASTDTLLLSVAETVLEELEPLIGVPEPRIAFNESVEESAERTSRLFQYVQENELLFRVLLLERGSNHFLHPVMEHAHQKARRHFFADEENLPLPVEMLVNHLVTATLSLLRWWLQNDMPYSPNEMGVYMTRIVAMPTKQNLLLEVGGMVSA